MDSMHRSPVTYRTLKKALMSLGFKETVTETHLLYENAESGAVVLLPQVEDDQQAQPVHLLTARWTVVEMGLTDAASFDALLLENGGRSKARLRTTTHPARSGRPKSVSKSVTPPSAQVEAA